MKIDDLYGMSNALIISPRAILIGFLIVGFIFFVAGEQEWYLFMPLLNGEKQK